MLTQRDEGLLAADALVPCPGALLVPAVSS